MKLNQIMKFLEIRDDSISGYELRKVNQLNMMAGYCIMFAIILNVSNLIFGRYPQFLITSGFALFIFIPTILLQRKRFYKIARNYFCLLQIPLMLGACLHNLHTGEFVHSENIFLVLAPVFVILYEGIPKIFLYALTVTCFFFIKLYDYDIRESDLDDMFFISSAIYLVVFLSIYSFIKSYMNAFFEICEQQSDLINRLAVQKGRLEKTNATKNKLFSIVSHDLQNPINMLQELLMVEEDLAEGELKKHRKYIKENVSRINSLIDTVLTWAKSQLEGFKTQIEEISINELLQIEFERSKIQAEQKGISITLTTPPDVKINSDANHVALVARNIIVNSIKFTPSGGEIHIKIRDLKYCINIEISDTGIGMDDATIEDILTGKFIASNSGTSGEHGYGLGLSLCSETLEKIGGTMLIESQKGVGTKFIIQLSKSSSSSQHSSDDKAQVST